ncbi:Hypothetical protein SRAE_2000104400 [Strongyloides ratti]|uniref:Uncharacterized protein n=1 Tax=Strongyloides ratti TaxID=34506 RepID=A0A090MY11_STRRB|nr:Hypothetical protein SRAE_2000104400 [Strongyloides ratti]CEF66374.1 Hypothetical protein SRAE_2000104400 [Strongyloides ratti]
MFAVCCLFGNWLSQAENDINSVIEIRKNGLFITTKLPIEEYTGINSSLYEELSIPTHVHNINDMTSDFSPILFQSDNIDITTSPDSTFSLENYHIANYSFDQFIRSHNSGIVLSTIYPNTSLIFSQSFNSLPNLRQHDDNILSQILVSDELQTDTININNNQNNNHNIFYVTSSQNFGISKKITNNEECQITLSIDNLPSYEEIISNTDKITQPKNVNIDLK